MIQKVLMPKLGQTMEEAVVEKWRKQVGDPVAKGDVLMEIQTDKATLEVESFVEGTLLAQVAEQGESFPVNTVVALVGDQGDKLPDVQALRAKALEAKPSEAPAPKAAPEPAPVAAPAVPAVPAPRGRVIASPRARRRARDAKISYKILVGSGPNGRIVDKDVLAYLQKLRKVKATPTARQIAMDKDMDLLQVRGTGAGGKITKDDALAHAPATPAPAAGAAPMSAMRRIVADRMSQSKREAPHFYLTLEADMTAAIALRKSVNAEGTVKVSYHDLLLRACGLAMAEQPAMNVAHVNDGLVQRGEVNVGLAVAIEDGLMVPVVHGVDRLSLTAVARKSRELVEKARGKRLTPDEYQGGCLTVSNLGMFGIDWFYPIINPGEPAILGVGRIAEKPVAIEGGIHVRPMMSLALCADHRAVDGAIAAAFLERVKEMIEAPEALQ